MPRDVAVLVALETVVMNPFLGVFFSFRHETVVFSQADKAVNLCVIFSGGAGAGAGGAGAGGAGAGAGAGGRFSGGGLVDGGGSGLVLLVVALLVGAVGVVETPIRSTNVVTLSCLTVMFRLPVVHIS